MIEDIEDYTVGFQQNFCAGGLSAISQTSDFNNLQGKKKCEMKQLQSW